MTEARQRRELSREECLALLGEVSVGRVVFTRRALPAIRPVNHIVEDDQIIIRATLGAAITSQPDIDGGTVVAYQADLIDTAARLGWNIVVVGRASHVTDVAEADRYRKILPSWDITDSDDIIAIRADVVTGFRLVPDTSPQSGHDPQSGPDGRADTASQRTSGPFG
jgi:hypothetical protein